MPSEATFSRAFAEFAAARLGPRLLEAVVVAHHGDHLVGHVARDSTAIEARERPAAGPGHQLSPSASAAGRARARNGRRRRPSAAWNASPARAWRR